MDKSRYSDQVLKYVKSDKPWPITVNAAYKDALIKRQHHLKRGQMKGEVFNTSCANSNDSCYRCGRQGHHQNQRRNVIADKIMQVKTIVIVINQESQLEYVLQISVVNATETMIVGIRMI